MTNRTIKGDPMTAMLADIRTDEATAVETCSGAQSRRRMRCGTPMPTSS
jgi:hypothetical protein